VLTGKTGAVQRAMALTGHKWFSLGCYGADWIQKA